MEPHGHITLHAQGADVIIGSSAHSISETDPVAARRRATARCAQAAEYYRRDLYIKATDATGERDLIIRADGRVEKATAAALEAITRDGMVLDEPSLSAHNGSHAPLKQSTNDHGQQTATEPDPERALHAAEATDSDSTVGAEQDPQAYLAYLPTTRAHQTIEQHAHNDSHDQLIIHANPPMSEDVKDHTLSTELSSAHYVDDVSFLQARIPQAPASIPEKTPWWRRLFGGDAYAADATREREAQWADTLAISQHWTSPRTIAVINGKGGVGKTPTTVLLAALFARHGGSGVLAWDTNITRGTLGWRTESSPHHQATVQDLLPHTKQFLGAQARAADLAAYVHHQTIDQFDVLNSNPLLLSTDQMLSPAQLDGIHAVATKFYRLTFMDSGNDEGAALWLRMIDHADQIVVPTSTRLDHAEAARLLLHALHERDEHSRRLAQRAVVIVSQADREEADADHIARTFADIAREVVTIPYDPAMRRQWLQLDALAPSTRRAYLRAAAAVAGGL